VWVTDLKRNETHSVAAHSVVAHSVAAHSVVAHSVAAHSVVGHSVAAHSVVAHSVAAHICSLSLYQTAIRFIQKALQHLRPNTSRK